MSESPNPLAKGQFDRIAKALADPRRFALLEAIAGSEEYPCPRLCRDFPVCKATISHHIKELLGAGLIEADRRGQYMDYRVRRDILAAYRSEEHTSELQSHSFISYAVFCLTKKNSSRRLAARRATSTPPVPDLRIPSH